MPERNGIDGRELECAVLGNDDARASVVGEEISAGEFYDYASKYVST
jgi:D-alanine-D-alanine ligase